MFASARFRRLMAPRTYPLNAVRRFFNPSEARESRLLASGRQIETASAISWIFGVKASITTDPSKPTSLSAVAMSRQGRGTSPGVPRSFEPAWNSTMVSFEDARSSPGQRMARQTLLYFTHCPFALEDLTAASMKARPLTPSAMVGNRTPAGSFSPLRAALMAAATSE